jgi:hypothetical protein
VVTIQKSSTIIDLNYTLGFVADLNGADEKRRRAISAKLKLDDKIAMNKIMALAGGYLPCSNQPSSIETYPNKEPIPFNQCELQVSKKK